MLHTFFDRASDTNAMFVPIVEWAAVNARRHINAYELAHLAWDKERMHKAISIRGYTPATIVLPSYNERPVLPAVDLGVLGTRFTVKPANGGGGVGVVNGATSMEQVLAAREQFPSQKYLVQSYVVPARFDSRRAWFRVIYCMGKVYSCWWDLDTHVYTPVTSDEEDSFGLTSLGEDSILFEGLHDFNRRNLQARAFLVGDCAHRGRPFRQHRLRERPCGPPSPVEGIGRRSRCNRFGHRRNNSDGYPGTDTARREKSLHGSRVPILSEMAARILRVSVTSQPHRRVPGARPESGPLQRRCTRTGREGRQARSGR